MSINSRQSFDLEYFTRSGLHVKIESLLVVTSSKFVLTSL